MDLFCQDLVYFRGKELWYSFQKVMTYLLCLRCPDCFWSHFLGLSNWPFLTKVLYFLAPQKVNLLVEVNEACVVCVVCAHNKFEFFIEFSLFILELGVCVTIAVRTECDQGLKSASHSLPGSFFCWGCNFKGHWGRGSATYLEREEGKKGRTPWKLNKVPMVKAKEVGDEWDTDRKNWNGV